MTALPELEYLRWAHARYGHVRIDLASSNAPTAPRSLLGDVAWDDEDAPARFADALSRAYGVRREEVLPTLGTSHALWLACRTLLEPGHEVLVESPCYEPLARVPEAMGARVRYVQRPEPDYRLDPDWLIAAITPSVRMVLVSNLHNPSGARADVAALMACERACGENGAWLVVDEVYGPFGTKELASARAVGPRVIALGSLTKRWGLGWARSGWLFGPATVVAQARTATRYVTGQNGSPHAAAGVAALLVLPALTERADAAVGSGASVVDAWVRSERRLDWCMPSAGPFGLVRVAGVANLRERIEAACDAHGVLVAPGEFFGVPDAFRVSWLVPPPRLEEGLARLAQTLFS